MEHHKAYRTKDGRFEEFAASSGAAPHEGAAGKSGEFVLHERDYHGLTVVEKYSAEVQEFGPNKVDRCVARIRNLNPTLDHKKASVESDEWKVLAGKPSAVVPPPLTHPLVEKTRKPSSQKTPPSQGIATKG